MKPRAAHKSEVRIDTAQSGAPVADPHSASGTRPSPEFRVLLVAIDFSDCSLAALNYAVVLSQRFHAKIVLLHVVEPAVYPENYLVSPGTVDEANQNLLAGGEERLAKVKSRVTSEGVAAETLVRIGRTQSDIADTARAVAADLIVMGTHGQSGLKTLLLGGTAERVLRHSHCPVLAVPQP
jgi:universal stress protein A